MQVPAKFLMVGAVTLLMAAAVCAEPSPPSAAFKAVGPALALKKKKRKVEPVERVTDSPGPDEPPTKPQESGVPIPVGPVSTVSKAHASVGVDPHFSVYFDLLLAYQPGKAELSFLNFHPLLLFEIIPNTDIQFSFEVNPSPRYYELDWSVAPGVQIRLGKIWIPFDDMNPHNFFGGVVGTSRMRLGSVYFLPDIWADLGVGAKFTLADSAAFLLEAHTYIINGFQGGGTDPQGVSADYPTFSDSSISAQDNNNDKGMGLRLHAWIQNTVGFGLSYFRTRWTPQAQTDKSVSMYGGDFQLRFKHVELKLGAVMMNAGLLNGSTYDRTGAYGELAAKLGDNNAWRLFMRAGLVDTDSRLVDVNDTMTIGGGFRYKPGLIGWSLEHYQDVKQVPGKLGYSFTGFRTIIQM